MNIIDIKLFISEEINRLQKMDMYNSTGWEGRKERIETLKFVLKEIIDRQLQEKEDAGD